MVSKKFLPGYTDIETTGIPHVFSSTDKDKSEKSTPRNGSKSGSMPFRARAERGRGGVRGSFRGGRGGGNNRLSFLERMKSKPQSTPGLCRATHLTLLCKCQFCVFFFQPVVATTCARIAVPLRATTTVRPRFSKQTPGT